MPMGEPVEGSGWRAIVAKKCWRAPLPAGMPAFRTVLVYTASYRGMEGTMPTWTARVSGWKHGDTPTSSSTTVGTHIFEITFDCACCEDEKTAKKTDDKKAGKKAGEADKATKDVDIDTYSSAVRNVRVRASFDTQFGDKQVTDGGSTVRVRKANCREGPGILVWIECEGEFNPNANPPPYDWHNWGMRGAWHICCCCDQITCQPDWSAVNARAPRGGASEGMYVVIMVDEKESCDAERQTKRYTLSGG